MCCTGMAWLSKSTTVSVTMKKYGALSINPMGRDKWKPTSCLLAGFRLGRSKDADDVYSIITQRCIYGLDRSTFLRYTGPRVGSVVRARRTMRASVPPKRIASSGANLLVAFFNLLQVKSKMMQGRLPTWIMMYMGESQRFGRYATADMGNTTA